MPTALPVIRGTSTALYPFTQTFICQTGVSDSQSANPTRWVKGPPLVKFEFPYNPLNQTEKDELNTQVQAFMLALKGNPQERFLANIDLATLQAVLEPTIL